MPMPHAGQRTMAMSPMMTLGNDPLYSQDYRDDQPECTYLKQTQTDRQHIFTVNDSAEYLEVIRELLQDERYNVTTTNVVSLTFDAISVLDPSLLLIDLVNGRPGRRSPC